MQLINRERQKLSKLTLLLVNVCDKEIQTQEVLLSLSCVPRLIISTR